MAPWIDSGAFFARAARGSSQTSHSIRAGKRARPIGAHPKCARAYSPWPAAMEMPQRRKREVTCGADDAKEPERRLAWQDNVGQREFARPTPPLAAAGGDKIGSAQQLRRHIFGGIDADHRRLRREGAHVGDEGGGFRHREMGAHSSTKAMRSGCSTSTWQRRPKHPASRRDRGQSAIRHPGLDPGSQCSGGVTKWRVMGIMDIFLNSGLALNGTWFRIIST